MPHEPAGRPQPPGEARDGVGAPLLDSAAVCALLGVQRNALARYTEEGSEVKPDLDYPWQGAFREMSLAIAERAPTEQKFDELWSYLGVVVRFLVTNDPRRDKNDPAPEEPGGPHTPESGCGVVR